MAGREQLFLYHPMDIFPYLVLGRRFSGCLNFESHHILCLLHLLPDLRGVRRVLVHQDLLLLLLGIPHNDDEDLLGLLDNN